MTSCNDKDEPLDQPTIASRTILVYMVSNNTLGAYGYDSNDLAEMVQASLNSDFNGGRLIIYHAPYNNIPTLYEISNGKVTLLKEYDLSALSVDAQRMQEVINDTKRIAPANSYGLILWSHANGWLQTGITNKANTPTDFTNTLNKNYLAFGEDQGKHMNITSLAQVINDENFDFIYCDCCYMGSIEVAYELRNATPYIIASATEIPADGMPYDYNLPLLFEDTTNFKKVCATTYDLYNCKHSIDRSCTISLIDTQYLEQLAQLTAQIYKNKEPIPHGFKPQQFTLDANCYFYDFAQYIEAISTNHPQLYEEWENALNDAVIYKASTPYMWNQLKLEYHCGLSTYILKDSTDYTTKGYNQLQWWSDVVCNLYN